MKRNFRTYVAAILVVGVGLASALALRGLVFAPTARVEAPSSARDPFTLPGQNEDPFEGDGKEVDVATAAKEETYSFALPESADANGQSVVGAWILPGTQQLAVTYDSGVRIYIEAWEGIDGPELYKEQIADGYDGRIETVDQATTIVSDGGQNADGSIYPAVVRFTLDKVTYKIIALPGFGLLSTDLITVAESLVENEPRAANG